MFEAEKMLKMVLAQASMINKSWREYGIEQMVTTQTKIDSYLSQAKKSAQKSEKSERLSTL